MVSLLLMAFLGFNSPKTSTSSPDNEQAGVSGPMSEKPERYKRRFTATFADPSALGTLTVDIKRGAIRVQGHDQSEVVVDLDVPDYYRSPATSDGLKEVRSKGLDFKVISNGNAIKVDSSSQRYVTNLSIKVPVNVNLVLDSYREGKLHVSNVNGQLSVRSFHSDITLSECSGSADVYTYHGNLAASLNSVSSDGPLEFDSHNGSIDLRLPPNVRLTTTTRTGRGKLLTDFNIEEGGDRWAKEIQKDGSLKVESDDAAEAVRKPPLFQDLQQHVGKISVRLLDFVEQDDGVWPAADLFGELAAFLIADISGRGSDQSAHIVLLHVLAHVDLNERILVAKHEFGQRFGQQRLADASGPTKMNDPRGRFGSFSPARDRADRAAHDLYRGLLADHHLVNDLLHLGEALRLLSLMLELGIPVIAATVSATALPSMIPSISLVDLRHSSRMSSFFRFCVST